MTETKNILLIGRSGRGKSTLANVITGAENKFKESSGSASETKKIQFEEFENNKVNYLIVDTPGIGDTKMSDNEVLDIIAEAVYRVKEGVSQVLFVVGGRFDQYEMATYNLLRTIIFDKEITKHTTVVRTRFDDFDNEEKCLTDINSMTKEAEEKKKDLEMNITKKEEEKKRLEEQGISHDSTEYQKILTEIGKLNKELQLNITEIIESCQNRVIHVNNPPINVKNKKRLEFNKKFRIKSREKILEHLQKTCQEDSYNPTKLQELGQDIAEDMDKLLQSRKELEEEMQKLKTASVKSSTNSPLLKATGIKKQSAGGSKSTAEVSSEITELTTEGHAIAIAIGKIKELEDKKAKLRKEIAEKEKNIRQKVLKHIFNNIDNISNELGGDIFLESVIGEHDWKKISPEFSDKGLVVNWLSKKFDYEQVQKWATALGKSFNPKVDAGFCAWLRDDKKLTVEKIQEVDYPRNIEELRREYVDQLELETKLLEKHKEQLGKKKKYILPKENFQKLIQLTFSKEVAEAYQAKAEANQDIAEANQEEAPQDRFQAWKAEAEAYQAVAQDWAKATQEPTPQIWAQAYQTEAEANQASALAQTALAKSRTTQAYQAKAEAYQTEAEAYQAVAQDWAKATQEPTPQIWAQAYQTEAEAALAKSKAFRASAQANQAKSQTYQAVAEATLAKSKAYQAVAEAYWEPTPQIWAQAYQAVAEAYQASAQAWQAWSQAEAEAYQTEAQHLKINLTLEKIESFFIEVKEETEEGKVEVSIDIQSKKN